MSTDQVDLGSTDSYRSSFAELSCQVTSSTGPGVDALDSELSVSASILRRSPPGLSRTILKDVGDQFTDEPSASLSCALVGTVLRPHVLLRRSQILPYHAPHLQACQSLLRLRRKADPWTVRHSSHHSNAYYVETSSSPGTGDNHIESPFGPDFSFTSNADFPSRVFQLLRSQFSGTEGRQCSSQVAESSESIVQPQGSTPEYAYDWSNDEILFQEYLPSSIGHYGRKTFIDECTPAKFTAPAMQIDFNTCRLANGVEEVLPMGWTKHTHSDGKPYFYHDHDKVITEEWLYERDIAERIARYINILKDAISKRSESFDRIKFWHIYVEIAQYELPAWEGDDRFRCRYYFVNHDVECLFWLSKFTLDNHLSELRGKMSPDLIRRYLRGEYWNHHYFFSDLHRLTKAQWNTVQKYILLAETDVTMSEVSTVTRSSDTLKTMRETIFRAEKLDASEVAGKPASYMMALLCDQILNYHGQRDARINWYESVYGYDHNNEKRTVPFRIANLLLFYAPIKHYTSLHKVWVDRLISRGPWQRLIEQNIYKLNLSNGMATVFLAVSMAFLAIPSVDDMGADQQLSVTKIPIYFSVVVSLGSIIIGLFLISHHTALKYASIDVVRCVLEQHWQTKSGFERLAIVYSVPHALLMWGMTSFLISFLCMCLEAPNPRSLKCFVVLAYLFITAFVLWVIYLFWEGSYLWIWRYFELQKAFFTGLRTTLLSIMSHENLRQLRDKIWRTDSRTGGSILPTTANGE